MVIAKDTSMNSKTQEQMTDIIEDDKKENALPDTNPLSFVNKTKLKLILPNTNNLNGTSTLSVGVDLDTQIKKSMTTDECKYNGDIYANKKHGKGVLSWSDGRMYTGAFFADKRHGFGMFHHPDISEFKGLYCHDERFGPGILIYKSIESADVGLWLSEDLIRILYPHPNLILDIQITDKKSSQPSSLNIPSWYSPEELLRTVSDLDFVLRKKSATLFCNTVQDKNSLLSRYIIENIDRVKESMHDKYAQLDAYLSSIDETFSKENISKEQTPYIIPPNQTYEQQQLYYYANKFWPFKQRALFPIDDIISNTRSSFPIPGPLENASLNLFEFSYNGQEKEVQDLLIQRLVYVDVCDSRGLTALHFATYNGHINVINTLLNFGANVNQLSDDNLTPLSLAFLLYYGNNPQETINSALEHSDPIVLNPRTSSALTEMSNIILSKQNLTHSSGYFTNDSSIMDEMKLPSSFESIKINDSEINSSYGFELTNNLRERIVDEQFRQSIYSVILLLLRRGADPSFSDWPLPVLALAIRACDKQMIEILLKKKVQVNCQLDSTRHSSLTPLHIACGCSSSDLIDIARQLLEHGAFVNAESASGNKEYLSLIDPLIIDINKMNDVQQRGRTPLHIACTREETSDTLNLVRLLLEYEANPNAVCNGQTPLTLAIILGNESVIDLLLNHEKTDPSTMLGLGNGNALCTLLSTFYESRWTFAKRLQLIERLVAKTPKVLYPIKFGPKNALGSSVDFAYFTFSSDTRISQTPFHSLTSQERTIFSARKELLAYLIKRFREEALKYEDFLRLPTPTPTPDIHTKTPSPTNSSSRAPSFLTEKSSDPLKASGEFRYCATCCRSTGVRLTVCKRCQKTSFCSKACKINGWNRFHRYECRLVPSPSATMKSLPTRNKILTSPDRVLLIKIPPKTNNQNNRLPPLSVTKLLRQKRAKQRAKSAGHFQTSVDGIKLSWNHTYNAPENYSFN